MKPSILVAEATTPDGAILSLYRRDGHFDLRIGGHRLMGTIATGSEEHLAELACAGFGAAGGRRVLIGGLGLGFTLRRVLELVHPDTTVQVAELVPEVVAWNREHLQSVNGGLVDDPRVEILVEDVFAVLERARPGSYDAVLLDVDNGAVAFVDARNTRLYDASGLRLLARALRRGGHVAFWSSAPDRPFMKRLSAAGFRPAAVDAKSYAKAKRRTHTLIIASWRA